MVNRTVMIKNKAGLHLRPARELSRLATSCKSSITIVKDDKRANPKSIINLMSIGIGYGDIITIECDGNNEERDLQTIINAIQGGPYN